MRSFGKLEVWFGQKCILFCINILRIKCTLYEFKVFTVSPQQKHFFTNGFELFDKIFHLIGNSDSNPI